MKKGKIYGCRIVKKKQRDGRWFAEYFNSNDIVCNGIGQFGKTPVEAEVNLQALLNAARKEQVKTIVIMEI